MIHTTSQNASSDDARIAEQVSIDLSFIDTLAVLRGPEDLERHWREHPDQMAVYDPNDWAETPIAPKTA